MRFVLLSAVLGFCAAFVIWGGRKPAALTPPATKVSTAPSTPSATKTAAAKTEPGPAPQNDKPERKTKHTSALKFTPEAYDFGEHLVGQQATTTVKVENPGETPIEIKHVAGSCGCIKTKVSAHTVPAKGSVDLEVRFIALPGAVRPKQYEILIHTSEGPQVRAVMLVSGATRQIFMTKPGAIFFDGVRTGVPHSTTFVIEALKKEAFEIKSVKADDDMTFTWQEVPGSNRTQYTVTATVTTERSAPYVEVIAVLTDHAEQPVTEVKASIRTAKKVYALQQFLDTERTPEGATVFRATIRQQLAGKLEITKVTDAAGASVPFDLEREDEASVRISIKPEKAEALPSPGAFQVHTSADPEPLTLKYERR